MEPHASQSAKIRTDETPGVVGPEPEEVISCKIWDQKRLEGVRLRTRGIYEEKSRARGDQRVLE